MSSIDLICEACGESNPAGSEFCRNCNEFLAWDRSVLVKPPSQRRSAPPPQPVPPTVPPPTTQQPTVPLPPVGQPTPSYPSEAYAQGYPPNSYPPDQYPTQELPADPYAQSGYVDPAYAQGYPEQGYADQGGYYDQASYDQAGHDQGYYDPASDQEYYDQGGYQPPAELTCPTCGRVNPGTLRFCARCGYSFVSSEAADYGNYYQQSGWNEAAADRAARREYRRSLPPLYRWRRVLIAIVVAALATVGIVVLHRDPVGIVKDVWYSLNRDYKTVSPVQAQVLPLEATADKSDPAELVDSSVEEYTMNWAPGGVSNCGPAPGTGVIILTFAPTRIRQIQIVPGLDKSNPQRPLQPLPKTIGLSFNDDPCQAFDLAASSDPVSLKVDSKRPVTQIRMGIGSAYPAGPDAQQKISITEIILKTYPS